MLRIDQWRMRDHPPYPRTGADEGPLCPIRRTNVGRFPQFFNRLFTTHDSAAQPSVLGRIECIILCHDLLSAARSKPCLYPRASKDHTECCRVLSHSQTVVLGCYGSDA